MEAPKNLTPIQREAFADIAREILVGKLSGIDTSLRQKAAFRRLHRADALKVGLAIIDAFDPVVGRVEGALTEAGQ
jgi:hypothetical protein